MERAYLDDMDPKTLRTLMQRVNKRRKKPDSLTKITLAQMRAEIVGNVFKSNELLEWVKKQGRDDLGNAAEFNIPNPVPSNYRYWAALWKKEEEEARRQQELADMASEMYRYKRVDKKPDSDIYTSPKRRGIEL